ncbi:MAG: NACHT domain-containing protein [Methylococcaceae bacterium]
MNGYEFVEKILGQTNYDVEPLIQMTHGLETEWLEFKAATEPKDGQFQHDENIWDYRWHVSKALFAMANSVGGAVIVGIGENTNTDFPVEPVSLEMSGFNGNKDKFMMNFESQILHPQDGWSTVGDGRLKCLEGHNLFRPIWGTFNEHPVIIILIKPREKTEKWLQLECSKNKSIHNVVLTRSLGDIGRVKKISDGNLVTWWQDREIDRSDFNELYQSFLSTWKANAAQKHPESFVGERIFSYLNKLNSNDNDAMFVPLQAKRIEENNVFSQFAQPRDVINLLAEETRVVLLGDPGSGKSKCLRQKAMSLAKDWEPNKPWALLISLYEYSESGLRSLLLKQLDGLYWVDIEADINSGKIILILDGLNECPSKLYEYCHQEIVALLKDYPLARIVISSRLTHEPSIESKIRYKKFDLCSMNRDQQQRFLSNKYLDENKAQELLNRLYLQPGAEIIASSPVLLEMVANVMEDNVDFPMGIAKIYHRSLELWHQRETEKNKQNGGSPFWSFNRTCEALSVLAFQMRVAGKVSCSVSFARDKIDPILGGESQKFLDRIAQGLLLTIDNKEEFLHFAHETVQEYLAAEYLVTHPEALTKELLQDTSGKRNANWTMPLVFALEMMKNPPKEFLQNAWIIEPLLVAAALQDNHRLNTLPLHIHEDLWLKGVLHAIRGEDTSLETFEIACISRLPPKYPLPHVLTSTLRGKAFWYSAQTHTDV